MRPLALALIAVLSLAAAGGCGPSKPQGAAPPAAATAPPKAEGAAALMTSHPPMTAPVSVEPVAPPPGGLSIAEVWAQRKALTAKTVTVRGKVVKVNNGILGKNWVHLQDGSGSAADRTNDLTLTTDATVTVGEIVTMTGVLATGKDIGAGYAYDAIVENATVVK